jgi:hypothetical protein
MVVALYFNRRYGKEFKEMAARVRAEGARTIMVWSQHFKGPENLLSEARGVIIQKSIGNAKKIAHAYETLGQDVEIHFADDKGEFVDAGKEAPPVVEIAIEGATEVVIEEATDDSSQESVSTDAVVQDEVADEPDDEAATSEDADDRSDEQFFDDTAADESEAVDESGADDSEAKE